MRIGYRVLNIDKTYLYVWDTKKSKNTLHESASFNVPNKKEREKSYFEEFITKLLGRVFFN